MTVKVKIHEIDDILKTITITDSIVKLCGAWSLVIYNNVKYYKLYFIDTQLLYSYGRMVNGHFIEKTKNNGFLIGKTEQGILKNFIEIDNEGNVVAKEYSFDESPNSIMGIIFKNCKLSD